MKKGIFVLVVFLFTGIIGMYGKRIGHIIAEKPEIKTVRFSVFAGTDYSKYQYKKSKAKVVLTVYRFAGDKQELVWEGEIDKGSIKSYPSPDQPIFKEVSVFNVYDRNETLAAYYKVIYDYKGSEISYEEGISLSAGSNIDLLKIPI
ncbi:MAG: hypothetical protein JWR18_2138 [Segetibacter sp.]|jgi:hypothetical protein|nr:hypothetical protein [Segetibacter sp.]